MFGYVNADKPNMLIKDYATYKAYYCGLCKSIGTHTKSQLMRFSINYDITFLTILAHNYRGVVPVFNNEHCIAHPIGKKFAVVASDAVQECVADINMILGYYKLEDDVLDDGGAFHKIGKQFFSKKFKRAAKRYPALALAVQKNYFKLRELEAAKEPSLDRLADTFATILREVGCTAAQKIDDNLDNLCYNLGRWIYIIDAYDDLERDIKSKKFNPLLPSGGELTAELRQKIRQTVEFSLAMAIASIKESYNKMTITISEGALSNIIYCGLKTRTDSVLNKENCDLAKRI